MGKRIDALNDSSAAPHVTGTAKTDKREVSSVLAVLTEWTSPPLRQQTWRASYKPSPEDSPSEAEPPVGEVPIFQARVVHFRKLGLSSDYARYAATCLAQRDAEKDARVVCMECANYKDSRCLNHIRAGLTDPRVGIDFAAQLQHCPGFHNSMHLQRR